MTEALAKPLSGLWKPTSLARLYYGPGSVQKHLLRCLPSSSSNVFIITGSSLATETTLVDQIEQLLGKDRHAGTYSNIKQHAPVAQLDQATSIVQKNPSIDTVISIGGGSPIDSAKAISYRVHEKTGNFLWHIAIPTTLSGAECTFFAGYTKEDGVKASFGHQKLAPQVILYDASFARETPSRLWLSTGLRAMDHAVELMYHPTASEMPAHWMCISAVSSLFKNLPRYKKNPKDKEVITQLQLAAFASLGFYGANTKGSLGLSHSLGYALGSPYGIPHGVTSCLTLGHVVKLRAEDPVTAAQLARLLPATGQIPSGDNKKDATKVGDAILKLVEDLGLSTNLKECGVDVDQVPVIVKRATGGLEEGSFYDKITSLVRNLY